MTSTTAQDLGALFDPANRPDPYPFFRSLREAGPFPLMDGALVVVGAHATCARILRDPASSSDRTRTLLPRPKAVTEDNPAVSFLSMDPPDHTRLRRLVSKAFTPRVIAGLAPRITEIVDELFAGFAGAGRADIVPDLAYPLPVRIITELLGVPEADHDRFEGWSRRLVRGLDPAIAITDDAELLDIVAARNEFTEYFTELIEVRRRDGGDDLLSALIRIEEQGEALTGRELIAVSILLLVAGHETTSNLIANGVLALLRHPDALADLRADAELIGPTVEEVLRYDPPVQLTSRIVRKPTPIGDLVLPPDGAFMLLLAAANRDPAVFADPDRFDIHRDARAHLSFAAGPHFCLGANLARLEASIALSAFANRVTAPVLDEDELRYRPHVNLRGPERLIVTFDEVLSPR